MNKNDRFYKVAKMVPAFEGILMAVPRNIASDATEIRIRAGKPIVVETVSGRYICGTRCATLEEIFSTIKNFCSYSIYSYQKELSEGWITLKGGHRVGFTGTAFVKNNVIETINDISSLNVRISREHIGISDDLFSRTVNNADFRGLIVAGAPLSGKTTILRDYCRNLGAFYKTALLDERGEIASVYKGVPQNNVGLNTDVLNSFPKKTAIEQAIRVLSPEFIVCDEIGSDIDTLLTCAGNGVKIIVSIHCGSIKEAKYNSLISELINSGAVNYIVFLNNKYSPGNLSGLWCVTDDKDIYSCSNSNNLFNCRNDSISEIKNACSTA